MNQTERVVLRYNRSKCSTFEWLGMGMNSLLGILGSDHAYKRLFKRIMINYNKEFIATDHLYIDAQNIKSGPIGKTRKALAFSPLLTVQADPGYEITISYGDRDIYGASKEYVLNRCPTAVVRTIENSGHFPRLHNYPAFKESIQIHFHIPIHYHPRS